MNTAASPTTPDAAFLSEICERPEDLVPRLMYADWLMENGQPERGEFIQAQCRVARGMDCRVAPTPCHRCDDCIGYFNAKWREWELWRNLCPNLNADVLHAIGWMCYTAPQDVSTTSWIGPTGNDSCRIRALWRRGFVEVVQCSGRDWCRHHEELRRNQPIRQVAITYGLNIEWFRQSEPRDSGGPVVTQFKFADCKEWSGTTFPRFERNEHGALTIRAEDFLEAMWPGIEFEFHRDEGIRVQFLSLSPVI